MEEEISNHIKTGEGCSYKAVSVTPKIWMSTEVHGGNSVAIRIADNGSGIKAEVQQQLFEPMFTTKLSGRTKVIDTVLTFVKVGL